MADTNERPDVVIYRALRAFPSFQRLTTLEDNPRWFEQMITALTLLSEDQIVEYTTGTYDPIENVASATMVTDRAIVRSVATDLDQRPNLSNWIIRRDRIQQLNLNAAAGPFDNSWPGKVTFTATIEGQPPIVFPLEYTAAGQEQHDETLTVYRSLRRTLIEGRKP